MSFEDGVWRASARSVWSNKWVLILVVVLITAVNSAQDIFKLHTTGGLWVAFAWLPLAIAAHSTALTGQSGFTASGANDWSGVSRHFLWRSLGLSIIGAIPAVVVSVAIGRKLSLDQALGLFVILYASFESLVLAKWGTMLPACVARGDISLKAAGARGSRVFWYVLGRLWTCNGTLLAGAMEIVVLVQSNLQMGSTVSTLPLGKIIFSLCVTAIFALNLMMFATVLSRGYLIAEGKVPLSPGLNDKGLEIRESRQASLAKRLTLGLAILGIVGGLSYAIVSAVIWPAPTAQVLADCDQENDPTAQIAACTKVIDYYGSYKSFKFSLISLSVGKPSRVHLDIPYNNRAIGYYHNNQVDQALADADKAVALNPNDPKHFLVRGSIYREKNKLDLAFKDLDRSLDLDPKNSYTYLERGLAHLDNGEYDAAIDNENLAVYYDASNYAAYCARGHAYLNKQQRVLAIEDLTRCISAKPDRALSYRLRANAYADSGQFPLALADDDKAIALDPRSGDGYNGRCWHRVNSGDAAGALPDCNQAIQLNANDSPSLDSRGLVYEKLGKLGLAEADYRKALSLDPKMSSSAEGLARIQTLRANQ